MATLTNAQLIFTQTDTNDTDSINTYIFQLTFANDVGGVGVSGVDASDFEVLLNGFNVDFVNTTPGSVAVGTPSATNITVEEITPSIYKGFKEIRVYRAFKEIRVYRAFKEIRVYIS